MAEDMFHISELLPPGDLPELPDGFLGAFDPPPPPPDDPDDESEATFDEITTLTRKELGRRLRNKKLRDELPATGLFNILLAEEKAKDREAAARENREKEPERGNAVDLILAMNLPPDRKRALLAAELARMEAEYKRVVELLREDEEEAQ